MAEFGIFASEKGTSVSTPVQADVGIPVAVGTAPVHAAEDPAPVNKPVLVTSYEEAVKKFGMSYVWSKYTLCEVIYSHFKLFGAQPLILINVLDPTDTNELAGKSYDVVDHRVEIAFDAVRDGLTVKKDGEESGDTLTIDVDYTVIYGEGTCTVELLSSSEHYKDTTLYIKGKAIKNTEVGAEEIKTKVIKGLDKVDSCLSTVATVPDLILCPGYSHFTDVAAVMAAKAANISGLFSGKALVDMPTDKESNGDYSKLAAKKSELNMTSMDEILCWPKVALGNRVFHMSTQLAGLMAITDSKNEGVPFESVSNLGLQMDRAVLDDGTEVDLTLEQANIVRSNGIVTALNFMGNGWVSWGTYTACAPGNTDVKDYIYPISRTIDMVKNTVIRTFWTKVDRPMTKILIDNIVTTVNIWLSGLVGSGKLLGARAVLESAENPLTELMAGRVKIHVYLAPPSPLHKCDFVVEYDTNYVNDVFSAMMAS